MEYHRPGNKRVLIVDDSSVMRAMICEIFSAQAGYTVVGMAKNAEEAIQLEKETRPDIMAIDLIMPYIDGSQLLSLLDDRPSLTKIMLSSNAATSSQMRSRLLALGASAFYDKREVAADPDRFRREVSGLVIRKALGPCKGGVPGIGNLSAPALYPKPHDELQRIALLNQLGIANTEPDQCLDILARHLAGQVSFPVVAITLIGEDRLWVKSGVGVERIELPREETICTRAICHGKPFIVSDLMSSALKDLPMVASEPYFRSYAGAPIVSTSGVALGMMCMTDMRPRQPTPGAVKSLVEAAALAASFIEEAPGTSKPSL